MTDTTPRPEGPRAAGAAQLQREQLTRSTCKRAWLTCSYGQPESQRRPRIGSHVRAHAIREQGVPASRCGVSKHLSHRVEAMAAQ